MTKPHLRRTLAIALAGLTVVFVTACNPSGTSVERDTMRRHAGLAAGMIGMERYEGNTTGKLVSYTCQPETEPAFEGYLLDCTVQGSITVDGRTERYSGTACVYSEYTGDTAVAKLRTVGHAGVGGKYAKVDGVWTYRSAADYSLLPGEIGIGQERISPCIYASTYED